MRYEDKLAEAIREFSEPDEIDPVFWQKRDEDEIERIFLEAVDAGSWSIDTAIMMLFDYSDAYTNEQMAKLYKLSYAIDDLLFKEQAVNFLCLGIEGKKMKNGLLKAVHEYLRIRDMFETWFEADGEPAVIRPYDFITWAMERETIDVPQIMVDWKNRKDGKQVPSLPGEKAAGGQAEGEIVIPRWLWEGKDKKKLIIDMRLERYPDDAIAHVLRYGMGITNRTEIGRQIKEDGLEDSSYRKAAKTWLDKPTRAWTLK